LNSIIRIEQHHKLKNHESNSLWYWTIPSAFIILCIIITCYGKFQLYSWTLRKFQTPKKNEIPNQQTPPEITPEASSSKTEDHNVAASSSTEIRTENQTFVKYGSQTLE
jgi:hypothetical protein